MYEWTNEYDRYERQLQIDRQIDGYIKRWIDDSSQTYINCRIQSVTFIQSAPIYFTQLGSKMLPYDKR